MKSEKIVEGEQGEPDLNAEELHPMLRAMIPVARGIAATFGNQCEVVLHNLSRPRTSIVEIVNNTVTGRSVGDGIRELVWSVLRSPNFTDDMLTNYRTTALDGKDVKSTTILIRDEANRIVGALCINLDLSAFSNMKKSLDDLTRVTQLGPPPDKVIQVKNADVIDVLDHIAEGTIEEYRKPASELSREEKIEIVRYLDEKGVFRIRGSVDRIAGKLGTSRYTIYNYLGSVRAAREIEEP